MKYNSESWCAIVNHTIPNSIPTQKKVERVPINTRAIRRKYTIGMKIKLNFINITLSSYIGLLGYLFLRKKSPFKHKSKLSYINICIFQGSKNDNS